MTLYGWTHMCARTSAVHRRPPAPGLRSGPARSPPVTAQARWRSAGQGLYGLSSGVMRFSLLADGLQSGALSGGTWGRPLAKAVSLQPPLLA